jgi:hypothetical protein
MAAKLNCMLILAVALGVADAALAQCPPDSVEVGPLCVDKFETSVWSTTNPGLIKRINDGVVRLAQLEAAGATQHGAGGRRPVSPGLLLPAPGGGRRDQPPSPMTTKRIELPS